MNYTFRIFQEINGYVYEHNDSRFTHIDLHVGNLAYEMEKKLTPEQMDQFAQVLKEYSDKKKLEMHRLSKIKVLTIWESL